MGQPDSSYVKFTLGLSSPKVQSKLDPSGYSNFSPNLFRLLFDSKIKTKQYKEFIV